mgnify:CR=1 FL=1
MVKNELKHLSSIDCLKVCSLLHPYVKLHNIRITEEEITFSDLDLQLIAGVPGHVPVNTIRFSDIIFISEDEHPYLRIALRTGYLHFVSKNSPGRFGGYFPEEDIYSLLPGSILQRIIRFITSLFKS